MPEAGYQAQVTAFDVIKSISISGDFTAPYTYFLRTEEGSYESGHTDPKEEYLSFSYVDGIEIYNGRVQVCYVKVQDSSDPVQETEEVPFIVRINPTTADLYGTGQYTLVVPGELAVGDDQTPWLYCGVAGKVQSVQALVKTVATGPGSSIDIELEIYNGSWNTMVSSDELQISDTENLGSTSTIEEDTIAAGNWIRLNIDAVGTAVAGADLVVTILFNRT